MPKVKEFENEIKKDEEIIPTNALENNAAYIQGTNVISAVKGPVFRDSQIGGRTVVPRDSSVIQETIDKLHKEGGGEVFLKNGTYKLNTDITMYSNIYLKGESRDLVILDFQDNTHGILAKGKDAYTAGTVSCGFDLFQNLVAYWKLDEASGNASDSSGNGNTLTNNGTTAYATGKINNGIDFESSGANQYLSITDAAQTGLDITGNISISAWVKNETLPAPGQHMCILNKADESLQHSYALNIYNDAGTYRVWMFVFQAADASIYSHVYWTDTLSTASWFHIAVSVTIANPIATKAECWINGTSKGNGTGTDVGGGATSIVNSTAPFEIGRGGGASGRYFDGLIDEVGVWSRALSSAEVTELYNSGTGLQHPFSFSWTEVRGAGTTFTPEMVGQDILLNGIWYPIASYTSATSITLGLPYSDVALSGATYTIATTISDAHIQNVRITNALYAIDVQYAKDFFVVDNIYTASVIGLKVQTSANLSIIQPRSIACAEGYNLSYVSLANFDECGALGISSGNGMTLSNCRDMAIGNLYSSGNFGDGISLTSCEDISIAGTIRSNGSNGIELVSGNNNITINNSAVEDNTSDGIKFTATSDNCFVSTTTIVRNGGYGVNIAASTCDNNIILGNNFASNTSGATSDSGTATKIRSNIGVADN